MSFNVSLKGRNIKIETSDAITSCKKLYEIEMNKLEAEKQSQEESKADIGWGSQIRSYVLDSARIKDLRTGVETSNCSGVLDGDLDQFIEESLKLNILITIWTDKPNESEFRN